MSLYLQALRIDLDNFAFVLDVVVDVAFLVANGKLRLAAQSDGSIHAACCSVDRGRILATSIEGKDAFRSRIIHDAVRIATGFYFLLDL